MMRTRRIIALGLVALAPLLARANDPVTAWVPNRWLPQGEVRFLPGDGEARIEVVLHTRHLDRVLRAIADKERANWGDDHPDARRYLQFLDEAKAALRARAGEAGRETLILAFSLDGGGGRISGRTGTVEQRDGTPALEVGESAELTGYTPSPAYLARNAMLILEDSLGMSREEALNALTASLGPAWTNPLAKEATHDDP